VVTVPERLMFGLISNGEKGADPFVWHAVRLDGEVWRTVCTAQTAQSGLTVIKVSPEPDR
jgi:hypothetical protein